MGPSRVEAPDLPSMPLDKETVECIAYSGVAKVAFLVLWEGSVDAGELGLQLLHSAACCALAKGALHFGQQTCFNQCQEY